MASAKCVLPRATLTGTSGVKRISRFDPCVCPCKSQAKSLTSTSWPGWILTSASMFPGLFRWRSPLPPRRCGCGPRPHHHVAGRTAKNWRDAWLGRRGTGVFRRAIRLWHSGHVKQVSLFCIPSGTMGTLSSEVCMRFGFRGYSHVVTAGCTSSTDALGYAYQHIQLRSSRCSLSEESMRPSLPESSRDTLCCGADAPGMMSRSALRGRSRRIGMALSWRRDPGCLCLKSTSMPARVERISMPRSPDTGDL